VAVLAGDRLGAVTSRLGLFRLGARTGGALPPAPVAYPNWPTTQFQVGIYSDPNDEGGQVNWTGAIDITRRVVGGWTAHRGAPYELGRTETGEMTVGVDNRDGALDPANAGSPYAGYVLPYRPIRILSTWKGVTRPVFTGFVERWPTAWTKGGRFGQSDLVCVDALAILAQAPYRSAVQDTTLADNPLYYWTLAAVGAPNPGSPGTSVNSAKTDAGTWNAPLTFPRGFTSVASIVPAGDSGQAVALTTAAAIYATVTLPTTLAVTAGFSTSIWMSVASGAGLGGLFHLLASGIGVFGFVASVGISSSGALLVTTDNAPSNATSGFTTTTIPAGNGGQVADGVAHLVTLNLTPTGWTVFVDNQPPFSKSETVNPAVVNQIYVGYAYTGSAYSYLTGSLQHVVLRPAAIPTTPAPNGDLRHPNLYAAGKTGFAGEPTGRRINRLLDYTNFKSPGVLTPKVSIDSGLSTVDAVPNGGSCLDAILTTADTDEAGTFYADAAGVLVFKQRNARTVNGAVAFTFGERVDLGEIPVEQDLATDFDPTLIYNDVSVTGPRITTPLDRADLTSQRRYGTRPLALSTNLNAYATDTAVQNRVSALLATYKDPQQRIRQLTFKPSHLDPAVCPNAWLAALGIERGTRVHVNQRTIPTISMDCYVEKITHTPDRETGWTVTLLLSPTSLAAALNF